MTSYGEQVMERWNRELKGMEDKDRKAKEAGKLVGRYIPHPCADGAAYYEIIRENKHSVRIRVVLIGDKWVLPAWGHETTIKKDLALWFLRSLDNPIWGQRR